jgi:hypothetical protein
MRSETKPPVELVLLKEAAAAHPDGREALRLAWLRARALHASPERLRDLICQARERRFAIPEIDAFVMEQIARARAELEDLRVSPSADPALVAAFARAIANAEATVKLEHEARDPAFARAVARAEQEATASDRMSES